MNAVEIEEAVSDLVLQPFDAAEFPFQFITAFGAKKATVDRLRASKNGTNQSMSAASCSGTTSTSA
ncbi:type IIL restriction-modification enzyme MmeI [Sphingomonas desiccabilis]|uniref:type IIL restriction-modification enzyme MmeI n=1 Tax=Sphingomonas desiccabilis TaxID=429134 RepID=UPI0026A839D4|nr:type IIL restriction-modification enzyme MmeI [Sphingomonas desiccabilis]